MSRSWPTTCGRVAGPARRGSTTRRSTSRRSFREAGLTTAPGAEGYFQPFTLPSEPILSGDVTFAVETPEGQGPYRRARDGFLGPGLRRRGRPGGRSTRLRRLRHHRQGRGAELDYDDYKDIDAKGKAVLIIRREPQQDDERQPVRRDRDDHLRHVPAQVPQRRGARGEGPPAGQRRRRAWRARQDQLLDFPAAGFDGGESRSS